jgi:DNA-3-methyladenine glycosylase
MQERFADFRKAYESELETNGAVDSLLDLAAGNRRVTLLYGARDPEVNHARVLLDFIRRNRTGEPQPGR